MKQETIKQRIARIERYINEDVLTMRNHCSLQYIRDFINTVAKKTYSETGTYGLKHQLERESQYKVYCSDIAFRWALLCMMLEEEVVIGVQQSWDNRTHIASIEEILGILECQMKNNGMTKCWMTFRLNKRCKI